MILSKQQQPTTESIQKIQHSLVLFSCFSLLLHNDNEKMSPKKNFQILDFSLFSGSMNEQRKKQTQKDNIQKTFK